jgi:glycosyltransferase involved in cell wall biosynthesis
MTTVALVSHSPMAHGAERMLLNLALLLRHRTEHIHPVLVIPGDGELCEEARRNRLEFHLVPPSPWYLFGESAVPDYRAAASRAWDVFKTSYTEIMADVVVVNTLTHVAPALAAIEMGLPMVLWVHGVIDTTMLPQLDSRFSFVHDSLLLASASAVVYNSDWTARHFRSLRKVEGGTVIHNWVPGDLLAETKAQRPDSRRIVCLNTFDETKGHATLLKAAAAMKRKGLAFSLDLFGEGDRKIEMQRLSRDLGLEDRVRFKGRTTHVGEVYDGALCLVNPSLVESFGMTLVEAMARKTPVVATRSGGPVEIVEDGVTGYLVDPGDEVALADRLEVLLNDKTQALRLGEAGNARVQASFSEDAAAPKFTSLLESVVEGQTARSQAVSTLAELYGFFLASRPCRGLSGEEPTDRGAACAVAPAAPPQGYARIGPGILYRLAPPKDGWCGLDLLVWIVKGPCDRALHLKVLSSDGHLLRQASAGLSSVAGEGWVSFRFDPIDASREHKFRLSFTLRGFRSRAVIILREASPRERLHKRILRRLGVRLAGNSLYARQHFAS